MSLDRDLDFHADEELLVPKNEPQYAEQPHAKDRGVAETTHVEPSTRHGRRHTTKVDILRIDAT